MKTYTINIYTKPKVFNVKASSVEEAMEIAKKNFERLYTADDLHSIEEAK